MHSKRHMARNIYPTYQVTRPLFPLPCPLLPHHFSFQIANLGLTSGIHINRQPSCHSNRPQVVHCSAAVQKRWSRDLLGIYFTKMSYTFDLVSRYDRLWRKALGLAATLGRVVIADRQNIDVHAPSPLRLIPPLSLLQSKPISPIPRQPRRKGMLSLVLLYCQMV